MTSALLDLSRGDGASHPLLADIELAQMINRVSGGAVIAPWQIGELPEDWLDLFRGLVVQLPQMRRARAEAERALEAARKG